MAKQKINEALIQAVEENPPKNPALSSSDKAYLRGLKRRGYTEQEITAIVEKAGMTMPENFFVPKKKKEDDKDTIEVN